ncbi:MAG: hypothetical protein QOG91_403 [Candidatus Parcubacteria bacterium]|jgi:phage shock protein PspC (stress-responsive transcriptional regulator)|nr:hypothetical protein [Candidatus Parcubacteria bacterium]
MKTKKMRPFRRINDGEIAGVCAGMAYAFGIPTWIVRVIWFTLLICYGVGAVAYVILWLCVPEWDSDPKDYKTVSG